MPTVSVVVPNYNHARYLRKRVESILAQTYQDFELILLDDASTDESREILRSYAGDGRVRTEFNEENSGTPFKQWNKGVGLARGKYVWIAESDDYAERELLGRLVKVLEEDEKVAFAYSRSYLLSENGERTGFADWYMDSLDGQHWKSDFVVDGAEECRRFFVLLTPVPNASAVVFRKEAYVRPGGADERLSVSADYKMWATMALGGKIGYVAEALNGYRSHGENVRSRSQAVALDLAEHLGVTRWVIEQVAAAETLPKKKTRNADRAASELTTRERIETAKETLAYISEWNLRNNSGLPREKMREYLVSWELLLAGREFALFPPNRMRFLSHRINFYRRYFRSMNWKQRLVNLGRICGAPLIGYEARHWPEQAYERVKRKLGRLHGLT